MDHHRLRLLDANGAATRVAWTEALEEFRDLDRRAPPEVAGLEASVAHFAWVIYSAYKNMPPEEALLDLSWLAAYSFFRELHPEPDLGGYA